MIDLRTDAATANGASFFREPQHFEILAQLVRARQFPRLRIWCAASSTGEEPYSIAMTLVETYNTDTPPIEIIASDSDTDVLAHAQRGVYPLNRLASVSAKRQARFFQRGTGPNAGFARVRPVLRTLIDYRQLHLQSDVWPIAARQDMIVCRNVLSAFAPAPQAQIVRRFGALIAPDGLLITGTSEIISAAETIFVALGESVYRQRMVADSMAASSPS